MKTYVVTNDWQVPYEDQAVLGLVLDFVRDLKPTGIILNGDIMDSYPFSRWPKNPRDQHTVEDEKDIVHSYLARIPKATTERWWLDGNHERHLQRYIWTQAPALGHSRKLDFSEFFDLGRFGFKWRGYGDFISLGQLMVTHGNEVRKHSAYSAKAHFERIGKSVMIGHTHRLGSYFKTNQGGTHVVYENGCLCKMDLEYVVGQPDWQHGFSVVHVDANGWFQVQQIAILDRRLFYFGQDKWERRAA